MIRVGCQAVGDRPASLRYAMPGADAAQGCVLPGISKLSAIVAADGVVDVVEFLRTFAWHDIRNIDHALQESKLQVSRCLSCNALDHILEHAPSRGAGCGVRGEG